MNVQLPGGDYSAALKTIQKLFEFPLPQREQMISDFRNQIEAGLAGKAGNLKMIPTYMGLPSGHEEGDFLAIDMGGTNLRVMVVRLSPACPQPQILKVHKLRLRAEDMSRDAHTLFSRVAATVYNFLTELEQESFTPPLALKKTGFTFSYPVTMLSHNSGKITVLAKELTASGLVGENPFDLLLGELETLSGRGGLLQPAALLNDTVTELIYASYLKRASGSPYPCHIGGIIGTGNNFAMVLETNRITKFKDSGYTKPEMILNMESGNFSAPSLPGNAYDKIVDAESSNPGAQFLEKTIAGNYLGRISAAVLKDLVEAGYLLQNTNSIHRALENFTCVHMSEIERTFSSAPEEALKVLQGTGLPQAGIKDLKVVKEISHLVSGRAAAIAATNVAAIIRFRNPGKPPPQTVAIDGSVFGKYPAYKERMEKALEELFPEDAEKIKLEYISDGSGIGAAIAAGV